MWVRVGDTPTCLGILENSPTSKLKPTYKTSHFYTLSRLEKELSDLGSAKGTTSSYMVFIFIV
ncbi:hypothetical protein Sjap_022401 [Stephania japonica]|uniref:Uncharacterized protein n=1 Tax=Stephania japonica TaxID=461633 RepID=A0AAP0EP98_9MAGN